MLICQNTAITKVAKALFKPFSFNQLQGTFISLQSQKKKKKRHCSGASIHQSIANLFGLTLLLSTLLYHAKGGEKDCCERLSTNVFCVVCACCSIFFFLLLLSPDFSPVLLSHSTKSERCDALVDRSASPSPSGVPLPSAVLCIAALLRHLQQ